MSTQMADVVQGLADELRDGLNGLRKLMDGDDPRKDHGYADFADLATLEDLYQADKLAFVIYLSIYSPERVDPVSPVVVKVDRLLASLHHEGLTEMTEESLEDKLREMSGMVLVQDFGIGTVAAPVLPVIANARVADKSSYLIGGHSMMMATVIGFAMAAASHAEGATS